MCHPLETGTSLPLSYSVAALQGSRSALAPASHRDSQIYGDNPITSPIQIAFVIVLPLSSHNKHMVSGCSCRVEHLARLPKCAKQALLLQAFRQFYSSSLSTRSIRALYIPMILLTVSWVISEATLLQVNRMLNGDESTNSLSSSARASLKLFACRIALHLVEAVILSLLPCVQ